MMTLLLLTQDERLVIRLQQDQSWMVLPVASYAEARETLATQTVDVILHDVPTPPYVADCIRLRATTDLPLVALVGPAFSSIRDDLLTAGITEMLESPVSAHDLTEHLAVLQVRTQRDTQAGTVITLPHLTIHLAERRIVTPDTEHTLRPLEWQVLQELIAHAGRPVPVPTLVSTVWGKHHEDTKSLRTTINGLRKIIEPDPKCWQYILTHGRRGAAYQYAGPPPHVHTVEPTEPAIFRVPTPRRALIGRDHLLTQVISLTQNERIVSLLGPPGVGKTRLALALAHSQMLKAQFVDGIMFVPLEVITEPRLVLPAIFMHLNIADDQKNSIEEQLSAYFSSKRFLLILDNCEQVLGAGPLVSQLLTFAPGLHVVFTSREPLNLYNEHRMRVPPLAIPQDKEENAQSITNNPSVALFTSYAQSMHHGFAVNRENAEVVACICRHLEGLPLALELAAAQVDSLPLHEIDATLSASVTHYLSTLTGGAQDLPVRQQSITGAVRWSYDLLASEPQRVFCASSVFTGGFTINALEMIIQHTDQPLVTLTSELVTKHLLHKGTGQQRYAMFQGIRAYAAQCTSPADRDAWRARHAHYFGDVAEHAEQVLQGADQQQWRQHIDNDLANIRAAFAWALEHDEHTLALRITGSLWRYWRMSGQVREGYQLVQEALGKVDSTILNNTVAVTAYTKALHSAGTLALLAGDASKSAEYFEEAITMSRQSDDILSVVKAKINLGYLCLRQSNRDETTARLHWMECLTLCNTANDEAFEHLVPLILGNLTTLSDAHERKPILDKLLDIYQQRGDHYNIASTYYNLGITAHQLNALESAAMNLSQALHMHRELGSHDDVVRVLTSLTLVHLDQHDPLTARETILACLTIRDQLGELPIKIKVLETVFGFLAVVSDEHQAHPQHVLSLWNATNQLRSKHDIARTPLDSGWFYPHVARLQDNVYRPSCAVTLLNQHYSVDELLAWATALVNQETQDIVIEKEIGGWR